jgi:hypothetical protein
MKKHAYLLFAALCLTGMLAITQSLSCKKAAEEAGESKIEEKAGEEAVPAEAVKSADADKELALVDEKKDDGGRGLIGHFFVPMELAKERLLQYQIDLTYESRDLMKSRKSLLGIVPKYGFVKEAAASLEDTAPVVSSDVMVRSDKIYDALLEMDRVGILRAEKITVIDHTEEMVKQDRTAKREQLRLGRKNLASVQVAPVAKNWKDVEESLEDSENKLDEADQAKWGIKDKVAWALVHVKLKGPDRIEVPHYGDTFIGLLNFLLKLVNVLIYLLPFAVIAGLIIWKRKQIMDFFKRAKKE